MKKGKIISMPTSIDTQIRTRARNLPIGKCYVSSDWEEAGAADVIVTRKHVNGNVTYGIYLVDLWLQGVKDCSYEFNIPEARLEERIENWDDEMDECDYALAHNIIFESIGFAEDIGFNPVKEFTKTGRYILEEDTDDIPQMDIPVGKEGLPVVFVTPDDDMQREIAILEKTVGQDNFIVIHMDEDGNFMDDEDDEDDVKQYFYEDYQLAIQEIMSMGIEKYTEKYDDKRTPVQMMALADVLYEIKFCDDVVVEDLFPLIIEDDRFDPDLSRLPETEKYIDSMQSIVDKLEDDKDSALAEMEALLATHPDDVYLGIAYIMLLQDFERKDQIEQLFSYWFDRAPNHYALRLAYAEWLVVQQRFDEVFEMFGDVPGLDAITKEDQPFTKSMVCNFCACYLLAWLSKDNINKAEPYYKILLIVGHVTTFVRNAFFEMVKKKKAAIMQGILRPQT